MSLRECPDCHGEYLHGIGYEIHRRFCDARPKKKFAVLVREVNEGWVKVEAENEEQALNKAADDYHVDADHWDSVSREAIDVQEES